MSEWMKVKKKPVEVQSRKIESDSQLCEEETHN
jgi:hypothetical protein